MRGEERSLGPEGISPRLTSGGFRQTTMHLLPVGIQTGATRRFECDQQLSVAHARGPACLSPQPGTKATSPWAFQGREKDSRCRPHLLSQINWIAIAFRAARGVCPLRYFIKGGPSHRAGWPGGAGCHRPLGFLATVQLQNLSQRIRAAFCEAYSAS